MYKTKKYIALFCLLLLVFVPDTSSAELTDVDNSTNKTAIQYLFENGIISGYPDGTFKPENTLNRAELTKMLVGSIGEKPTIDEGYKNCFPDVHEEWFAPFVCYAKTQGWVDGYPDGTFKAEQTVNKVEAIKMLVNSQNYITSTKIDISPFIDADINEWYTPYLRVAKDKGLLEELDNVYGVSDKITRGEISENIYRAMILATSDDSSLNQDSNTTPKLYSVVKVVDGDTIHADIDGQTYSIRLIGLNTPETVDPRKPIECFGREASNKAKAVLEGEKVQLLPDKTQGDTDKYNRLLRYVILEDGTNFNKMMIEEGYGFEYTYHTPYKYQAEFREAELYAQQNKKGLWADDACTDVASHIKTIDTNIDVSDYTCTNNQYNCGDFSTHAEAQAVYEKCLIETGTDIHRLDGADNDGKVCERLP